MSIIELSHVSKSFVLHPDRARSFQELFLSLFRRSRDRSSREIYQALDDISFSVDPGEAVALVGANGSGKSTCLKLISRIIEPTKGQVQVDGRISALLELGTGFHPELSGRENIFLYGSVLGLRRAEMARRFDDIVAFSELERFIDIPVKFYSSGMYVRLAFATAINVSADVLLVDEVLAVGDQRFQARCLDYINSLKRQGVTILMVSHDLDSVRNLCDRAIWLDKGRLVASGVTDVVVDKYVQQVYERGEADDRTERDDRRLDSPSETESHTESPDDGDIMGAYQRRWGTREAEIIDARFLDTHGRDRLLLTTGEPCSIIVHYRAHRRIEEPMFGLAIHRSDGLHITGPNTVFADYDIACIEGEGQVRYEVDALPLLPGTYYLTASICDHDGEHAYDYHSLMYRFRVQPGDVQERYGTVHIPGHWEHVPALRLERDA